MECSLSTQPGAAPAAASPAAAAGTPSPGPSSASHSPPPRRSRAQPININPGSAPRPPPLPSATAPPGDHRPDPGPSPNGSVLTLADSAATASPDPFPYLAKFVTGPPEEDRANWVLDLELLHHFTTATYATFLIDPARTEASRLWQLEVPRQAFVHLFLLHQILAIASYHKAYLQPQSCQAYSLRASQHQNAGIRQTRIALSSLDPSNCHALFASSSLLFIGSLAAGSANRTADGPTVDDLMDVLILVKGIGSVLNSSHTLLRSGPLADLFVQQQGTERDSPTLDRVVLAVSDFLVEIAETESDSQVRATIHADAYRLVTSIRDARLKTAGPEYRVVASWPILMSDDLIPLLRRRNQAALALLSYYCVVFHASEMQGYWFMQGWASGVIRDISKTMKGPWKRHSAWALGWITGHAALG